MTRNRQQRLHCLLESRHRLFPGHGWEVGEKFVERIAGLELNESYQVAGLVKAPFASVMVAGN